MLESRDSAKASAATFTVFYVLRESGKNDSLLWYIYNFLHVTRKDLLLCYIYNFLHVTRKDSLLCLRRSIAAGTDGSLPPVLTIHTTMSPLVHF